MIMKGNKIIVLGSSNTDMMIQSERLPKPGETILGGTFLMNAGGKGANQAVAAARLGGNVTFIAKVGDDSFGEKSIDLYKKEGIHTNYITKDAFSPSGIALINVDQQGENSIVVAMGANGTLVSEDLKISETEIKQAKVLLMQLEIPMDTVEYAANLAHSNGVKVILNPAPAQDLSEKLLKCLDIIILNETEAEMISNVKVLDFETAKVAANEIVKKGVDKVIITMGSHGAMLKDGDKYLEVLAHKVKAVDATAAGDTFCGAIAVAICEGKSLEEATCFANKCSAITVTKMGAQTSIPTLHEVNTSNL